MGGFLNVWSMRLVNLSFPRYLVLVNTSVGFLYYLLSGVCERVSVRTCIYIFN